MIARPKKGQRGHGDAKALEAIECARMRADMMDLSKPGPLTAKRQQRPKRTSPTARSLLWLRKRGWIAGKVEQRLTMPGRPWANLRDLWGFVDIVAVHPQGLLYFVQVTSGSNVASRVTKAHAVAPEALDGLARIPAAFVEFHGWRKAGPRGKRKTWQLRRVGPDGQEIRDA